MSNTIRVMFYDKTRWAGEELVSSWWAGGHVYKFFRKIDICKGVESWEEALDWMLSLDSTKKISMIQFWGHGSPGNVFINGDAINTNVLRSNHPLHLKFQALKKKLTDQSVIWFRSCTVFQGSKGSFFAKRWAQFFNCKIAGHTFVVGPWQSGLHTLVPDQEPYWPLDEGVAEEGKGWNGSASQMSGPFQTNTIFCLRGDIPTQW